MNTTKLPLEEARACARHAIDLLSNHHLPPSPINYAVAYEYHSRAGGDLQQALDAHLKDGKPLDEFLLADLYERHVAAKQVHKFHSMRNDLQSLMQSLMQHIDAAGEQTTAYRDNLEKNISRLGTERDAEALRSVAADLMQAALEAKLNNQTLQSKLESAQQETGKLREELELLKHETLIDPLTGLFNRRAMAQHLQTLWSETGSLSVLAMDIDHFKRINDTYGHAIGDVVLRHVADVLRKSIRGEDVAIRFGGEEFLILLPNTDQEGAAKVAETIRCRVAALRLTRRHDNLTLDPFTISLGVSARRTDDHDHENLIERADKALYQSKNNGRNKVTLAEVLH